MQGKLFNLPAALIAALLVLSSPAFADGSGPLSPFPITGAFSAEFREDRDHISIIEFSGNYDRTLTGGNYNAEPRAVVAQEFFRTHPDHYDFIVAFTTFEFETGEALAFHFPIQNKVQGLGLPVFDVTSLFGSEGKLLGFTDMAALSRWVTDPMDPEFEKVLSVLAHEILHQWGVRVRFQDAEGNLSDALLGKDGAHWSYLLDSGASVEYGADWRDNEDGTFTSVGIGTFYSPLDLYLMGMYDAEEVPPFTLIDNPDIDKTKLPEQGVTISGTARTVSIEDVIAAEGPRVPDAAHSQKEFRMAFVLLTAPGERADERQLLALNNIRKAFMTRFSVLTGGRAIAHVYPEAVPVNAPGQAATISGGELRQDPADLDAALAWLRSQQHSEGYWNDKPATRGRDTSVVLNVLERYDAGFDGSAKALAWLGQQNPSSTDYLSRTQVLEAQLGGETAEARRQLASLANSDGGWGLAVGYASDPLDTALALGAISGDDTYAVGRDGAVDYLLQTQNEDGGWSSAAGGASRASVTAEVLLALKKAGRADLPAMDRALAWIAGKQNNDGGFGDSPSTAHDTALVLLALMEHGALERIRPEDAGQYLLGQQTVDGSWAGSTYATALAVAALKQFTFSNWTVETVSASSATPHDGERVTITAVVRNVSGLGTPEGVLRIYAGDPQTGGAQVGTDIVVPPMAAGTALAFSRVWDSFDQPGTHTFFAVADPDDLVVETSERDNRGSVTIEVQAAPDAVDLELAASDITIMPAHPNRLPSTLGINVNLRNLGLRDAADVRVLLWDGDVGSGTLVGETTLDVLGRSTVVANFTYVLERAGTTRLTVQLDPDNAIAEAREDNNVAWAEVVLDPSVDLAVGSSDIALDRTSPLLGQDLTFSVKLHNVGTQPSPSASVRYLVTDGNVTKEIRADAVEIGPGETITRIVSWRAELTGLITFTVQLDGDALVGELDEENNVASIDFHVGTADGPNLVVGHQDLVFSPSPALELGAVKIDAVVRNAGTQSAADISVGFYDGDPAEGGRRLGTQSISTLAAGAQQAVSFTWDAVPDSTDKVLFVVVDPDNTIVEFAEDDNQAFNVLPVLSLPDLAISDGDLRITPGQPKVGDTVTVTAQLFNIGQQRASKILVRAYDGEPDTGGTLIGEQTLASLPPGEGAGVEFSVAFSSERAEQPIVVQLDPAGTVPETNTANNVARRLVTVQDGSLYVSNRYFSPNGDGVKDDTRLAFRLEVATEVGVQVVNEQDRVVRTFAAEPVALTAGSVTWDGRDDAGRVGADGDYRLRLATAEGTILGERIVTLDTNRSSLLKAMENGQARETNLTCHIDISHRYWVDIHFSENADVGFFVTRNGHLARWLPAEGRAVDVVSDAWLKVNTFIASSDGNIAPSPDGSRVFFVLIDYADGYYHYSLWTVDVEGGEPVRLGSLTDNANALLISPDGLSVLAVRDGYYNGTSVSRFSIDTPGDPTYVLGYDSSAAVRVSPDGRHLAVQSAVDGQQVLDIIDSVTGARLNRHTVYSSGSAGLSWSPDSEKLAVSGTAGLQVFRVDGRSSALPLEAPWWIAYAPLPDPSWDSSGTELYLGERNLVVDLSSGKTSSVPFRRDFYWDTAASAWEPGRRALFHVIYGLTLGEMEAYDFDENRRIMPLPNRVLIRLFGGAARFNKSGSFLYQGPTYLQPSASGVVSSSAASNPDCIEDFNNDGTPDYDVTQRTDIFLVESYSNLLARLDPARSAAGGLSLRGTATDLHFSDYRLEYSTPESPGDWRPVGPASEREVIDGELAFWVPPGRGSYTVRLTVNDLAGNTRTAMRRVIWSEPVSITNLYRSPDIFSPDGDGVKDEVRIHYRALEPVHLEFTIENSAGDVVRSYIRDHSLVGSEYDILWDGRDDGGVLLPDGDYTLRVQNYRLRITIDNTLPVAALSLRDAYQGEIPDPYGHPYDKFVAVDPGLSWEAEDAHLTALGLEKGPSGDPAQWQAFTLPQLKNNPNGEAGLSLEAFVGSRFRLTASDAAGNRVAATSAPAREQLIITDFGQFALNKDVESPEGWGDAAEACAEGAPVAAPDDWLEPVYRAPWTPFESDLPTELTAAVTDAAPFRIRLAETVAPTLTQLVVEYREHGGAEWQQASVEEYVLGMDYCAFISGQQDFLKIQPAAPEHRMDIKWGTKSLSPGKAYDLRIRGVDAAGNSHRSNTIQFHVTRTDVHLRGLVRDLDTRSEDYREKISPLLKDLVPAWDRNAEELLWGEQRLEQPVGEVRLLLRSAEDPRYATARVVDRVATPGEVFLFRVPDLRACTTYSAYLEAYGEKGADGTAPLLAHSLEPQPFTMPCMELETTVQTVFAETCGAPSPGQTRVALRPIAMDGGALKLLTLSRWDAEIGEDILYNVNQPESGRTYKYLLDTATLPEGPLDFTATLVSAEDKVVTESVAVQVDHTPPSVVISYPAEAQRVCGEPRQGSDGTVRNVLTLEAAVEEAGSWHYQVEANGALIHDSRSFDSLAASLGRHGDIDPPKPDLHLSGPMTGPVAALADGDGEVNARIRVFDGGGFQQCAATTFHFDGTVEIGEPSGDLKLISPNGDGESDTLTIAHRVDEAVEVDVGIYAAERGSDGRYAPVGTMLRTLESGLQLFPGETVSVWDGRDDGGAVVADGEYLAVIGYQDGCGNRTERTVQTTVDGMPPRVELTRPQTGDVVRMVVELIGTVDDANLTAFEIQYGAGGAPATWSAIASGGRPVRDGILGRWNTYGLAGDYTLRILAHDAAGNTSELLRTFNIPERSALLNQVEAVPALFSPNGDGRLEESAIRLGILEAVTLHVAVLSADGSVLRILAEDSPADAGDLTLAWDGRDERGQVVADGDYTVRIRASRQNDASITQEDTLTVAVDRSAPLIQLTHPATGFTTSAGGVLGTISDPHLTSYTVQMSSTPDAPTWTEIAAGTTERTDDPLATLTGLEEGEYILRIVAVDAAENQEEQVLRFGIDDTAPEVAFLNPAADAVLGAGSGPVAVRAEVREDNPAFYTLAVGEGNEPGTWSEVVRGDTLPLPSPLTELDISDLADGAHALQLVVEDKAGNRTEQVLAFQVDNTPPTAEIRTPSEGEVVTGPIAVIGSVSDANFRDYRIYVAAGTRETAANWNLLGQGTNGVEDDLLLNWQTMPANGTYTLRLVAQDKAGNSSQSLVQVSVSSDPPPQPEGLVAFVENGDDVHLSWSPVSASGVYGYHIYRDGVRITAAPVPRPEYLDAGLSDGVYRYAVTAVGNGAVESAKSGTVDVAVDATPPLTALVSVKDGDTMGGLVDVLGTAYAPSDFKEYRLYASAGSEPDTWQLLRQSPLPVSGALLGQWDTTALPEGAVYTLKLEAEDLTGNVGESHVSVTVDNFAPAAPTGLVALENGADVTLTWNANAEADVSGYLIYRDGEPVSASVVQGTGYTDAGVPDGRYDYVVVALDSTGNVSDPSLPATVLIDTRAPHAEIATPEDGAAFERPLYVSAHSEDGDIANVEFQYRTEGGGEWISVATDTTLPYEFNFDAAGLGLSHGVYQLQALATDSTGKTDPAPAPIAVTYKDLTRPAAVTGLRAAVRGGDVTLSWDGNGEEDLAGYYIYTATNGGEFERLNADPIAENSYVITGLPDGAYVYYVSAVDSSANQGDPSAQVSAVVFTPVIIQPYTPTSEGVATLSGRAAVPGTVLAEVATAEGTQSLPGVGTDGESHFVLADLALASGDNVFTVHVEDAAGNLSKPAEVKVVKGEAPGAPTGLVATVNGYGVSLSWNANPEPDLLGYRIFRDGVALHGSVALTGLSATASHNDYAASQIFNNLYQYWSTDTAFPMDGQWISVYWPESALVASLRLTWYEGYRASAYDVEVWSGEVWVPLIQVRDNGDDENIVELAAPYATDRLRVVIREGQTSAVRLKDIGVQVLQTVTETVYGETRVDGTYVYTVTAVSRLGFESAPSEPASVYVGDVIAPGAVELSGIVNGSDVSLSWMPSSSSDVERYDIYRDGELVAQHVDLTALLFTDTVINGSYTYTVRAVDAAGNASVASNPFVAAVNAELLSPPANVQASSVAAGGALLVSWTADSAASTYIVFRATEPGGSYSAVYQGAEPFFTDADLSNGTSYYYVVVAIDGAGNASAYSAEAVGVPADTQPPAVPIIAQPTKAGVPYETSESTVDVAGSTEPGAFVHLARDGVDIVGVSALSQGRLAETARLYANNKPVVSGDGRYVAYPDSSGVYVRDFVTGYRPRIATASDGKVMQWTAEGLVFVSSSRLRLYRPADGSVTELIGESASSGSISPDGRQIVFYSSYYRAVYLYDRETGLKKQLGRTSSSFGDTLRWSSDNRHVAFRIFQGCYLVDTATGSFTRLASSGGYDNPVWSPDGQYLVYTEEVSGRNQLRRYWVSEAREETFVGDPEHDIAQPAMSPQGDSLMYVVDKSDIRRMDLTTGESASFIQGYSDPTAMQWLDAAYLAFYSEGSSTVFALPGRFEFHDVPLHGGDNVFSARARDDAGNMSASSESILVMAANINDAKPDLHIDPEKVSIMPAAALVGEPVQVSVTVGNSGGAQAEEAMLSLVVRNADGTTTGLLDSYALESLSPGGEQAVRIEWTPVVAGTYSLVATADPADLLSETDELNNVAVKDVTVTEEAGPRVSVETDRTAYGANDKVGVAAQFTGYGEDIRGLVELSVTDANAYPVAVIAKAAVDGLSAGENLDLFGQWNTGQTFAGNYLAKARLLDETGVVLAEGVSAFTVVPSALVEAEAASNRASYGAQEEVHVTATVRYVEGNTLLRGTSARVAILAEDGGIFAEARRTLGDLMPDSDSTLVLDWNTGVASPGQYRVVVEAFDGEKPLAVAESSFEVLADGMKLSGSLQLSSRTPGPSEFLTATYQIRNSGNVDLIGLPVTISLVDGTSQTIVQSTSATISVPLGTNVEATAAISTDELELKGYTVLLQAEVTGDGSVKPQLLATAGFTISDRTPPVVELREPVDSVFLHAGDQAIVYAVDAHSQVAKVEVSIDGGDWVALQVRDASSGLYQRDLPPLPDGVHAVRARATDAANNVAVTEARSVVVDETAPQISISGVAEGAYYNTAVSVEVQVSDANPSSSRITVDGEAFTSGVITADGAHTINVYAEDLAGNIAERELTFTIDTVPPQISITGVESGGVYAGDVAPIIDVNETNIEALSVTLNGSPFVSGTMLSGEGHYDLEVKASDLAGNVTVNTIEFEIDKTPPGLTIASPADELTTRERTVSVAGLTEPLSVVHLFVNGYTALVTADGNGGFDFAGVPLNIGRNEIAVFALDRAGNRSDDVTVHVNVLPPVELHGTIRPAQGVLVWAPESGGPGAGLSLLRDALEAGGRDYLVVEGESDFVDALRTQRYGTGVLLETQDKTDCRARNGKSEDECENRFAVSADTSNELRLMVASGTGLVWIKTHPDANEHWEDLFGARFLGIVPRVSKLVLGDESALPAGSYDIDGGALNTALQGGRAVGSLVPDGHTPALVINRYGRGTAVLMAFDPSAIVDREAAGAILRGVTAVAASTQDRLLPGGYAEVLWTVSEAEPPLEILLEESLAEGMRFVSVPEGRIAGPQNALWTQVITQAVSEPFAALIKLSEQVGTYIVTASLSQVEQGQLVKLVEEYLSLRVGRDESTLALDVVNQLTGSQPTGPDQKSYREALEHIRAVIAGDGTTQEGVEAAIAHLLAAEAGLVSMKQRDLDLETALGMLLRSWQIRWSELR